jgi:RimJ/RimL family protein N-acetyltransferase
MALHCTRAVPPVDRDDFARFCCSDGSAWCDEAERHVRIHALGDTFALALRDDAGALVAVSSFYPRVIDLVPVVAPLPQPGWHLQVLAIAADHQRHGLAAEVFAETFARMREYGPERELVSAVVRQEHRVSRKVAEAAGLMFLGERGDGYINLVGFVPELR